MVCVVKGYLGIEEKNVKKPTFVPTFYYVFYFSSLYKRELIIICGIKFAAI